jgi:23S rRNA (cytidine2498-2'-O)-methyltransferase
MKIFTVKPGVESIAIAECNSVSISAQNLSKGIICAQSEREQLTTDHCFASWQFATVEEILCDGPGLMTKITEWFCTSIRSETINSPWTLIWLVPSENGFLPDHSKSVRIVELLKKKISRISKLAQTGYPESMIPLRGLFIIEGDNNRFFLSRDGFYYGQRRMKDDPLAPSRSFLKIEEAFSVFGQSPSAGDSVVDLGAAPGGWSYSAAKRGATVFAIDNGPLKKGASDNHAIKHMKQDAFFFGQKNRLTGFFVIWLKNHQGL